MFDDTPITIWVVAAGLAAAAASCLPVLFHYAIPTDRECMRESWRDRAPALFRWMRWAIVRFSQHTERRLGDKQRRSILRRLQEAGLSYAVKPAEVVVARWALALVTAVLALYLMFAYDFWLWGTALAALIAVLVAYFYIDIWLRDTAKRRKDLIEKEFPFFLDVVVLSMKAGLAFPAAVQQATGRMPDGPIRQELSRLIRDIRTGVSRQEGLQRLAERVRLASVSNFVAVVIQAEESGGSLTKALNEQARQRRRERFQRAEKLANQAPVKMLFPLVAFLFPVTFLIIGYPLYDQLVASGFLG